MDELECGDIAIVTTKSGHRYVGVYTDGSPVDYFWYAIIREDAKAHRQIADPDDSFVVIGKMNENTRWVAL